MKKLALVFIYSLILTVPALAEINVLCTIDKKAVPEAHQDKMREHGLSWVIVHKTTTRVCIDATIPTKQLALDLKDYLTTNNYNPSLIAIIKEDGVHLGQTKEGEIITGTKDIPFDKPEYINCMPDEVTYDVDGNEISRTRPVSAYIVHEFYGGIRTLINP